MELVTPQISTPKALEDLVAELRALRTFALDTEFIRERTYRPHLCLLQVATREKQVLIDPLAIEDLGPFIELVFDPGIEKIVHSGEQDMEIFYALGRRLPRNVYDTQIAAALAGLGESISYARLVEELLGKRLSKVETYTDWARRPLTPQQLTYALADVEHLHAVRDRLHAELEKRGRLEWLREELEVHEDRSRYEKDLASLYKKVRAAAKLDGRELAVLRELAAWREEEAERMDRPRGRILLDESLVELARRAPKSRESIAAVRGIHPQLIRRSGDEIVRRVAKALELPPSEYPQPVERRSSDAEHSLVVDLLEVVLRSRAAEVEVAPGYLGSRRELAELARMGLDPDSAPADVEPLPILSGWRKKLVGDALLDLLRGRSHVAVDPEKARVEVVRREGEN